jgi:hypothetical protein
VIGHKILVVRCDRKLLLVVRHGVVFASIPGVCVFHSHSRYPCCWCYPLIWLIVGNLRHDRCSSLLHCCVYFCFVCVAFCRRFHVESNGREIELCQALSSFPTVIFHVGVHVVWIFFFVFLGLFLVCKDIKVLKLNFLMS